jgi:hypothetical protein
MPMRAAARLLAGRVLGYPCGGIPVLTAAARLNDLLDPAAGRVAPASLRTDGVWIWTGAVAYYLSRHGLAPDARLAAHLDASCARGHGVPDTDPGTATRAAGLLLRPPADQATAAVSICPS